MHYKQNDAKLCTATFTDKNIWTEEFEKFLEGLWKVFDMVWFWQNSACIIEFAKKKDMSATFTDKTIWTDQIIWKVLGMFLESFWMVWF